MCISIKCEINCCRTCAVNKPKYSPVVEDRFYMKCYKYFISTHHHILPEPILPLESDIVFQCKKHLKPCVYLCCCKNILCQDCAEEEAHMLHDVFNLDYPKKEILNSDSNVHYNNKDLLTFLNSTKKELLPLPLEKFSEVPKNSRIDGGEGVEKECIFLNSYEYELHNQFCYCYGVYSIIYPHKNELITYNSQDQTMKRAYLSPSYSHIVGASLCMYFDMYIIAFGGYNKIKQQTTNVIVYLDFEGNPYQQSEMDTDKFLVGNCLCSSQYVILCGGCQAKGEDSIALNDIAIYDLKLRLTAKIGCMKERRISPSILHQANKVIIIGGRRSNGSVVSSMEIVMHTNNELQVTKHEFSVLLSYIYSTTSLSDNSIILLRKEGAQNASVYKLCPPIISNIANYELVHNNSQLVSFPAIYQNHIIAFKMNKHGIISAKDVMINAF